MTAVTNQKRESAAVSAAKEKKPAARSMKKAVKETVKEPVKQAVKQEAPKQTAPKKQEEPKATVHFQFDGKDLVAKDILDQAMKAYKESHPETEVKTIELYVVASEEAAYYVVNGEAQDDFKILL